ncbi:MAG: TIGR01620 family protein, partial [Pseudomonas stutzeri]|nr:TIGR01620 family protein [Stutzerimonas stutzeri]
MTKGPILIDLDTPPEHTPETAPAVTDDLPAGEAMQVIAQVAAKPRSP